MLKFVDGDGNLQRGAMLEKDSHLHWPGRPLLTRFRPEVKAAVLTCQTAGIRPVMITGDHPLTAQSIRAGIGDCSQLHHPHRTRAIPTL